VRKNYFSNYYPENIKFQGLPSDGYHSLFKKLLNNDKIKVILNLDFNSIFDTIPKNKHIIYTGAIDNFFKYTFGKLDYRTVTFDKKIQNTNDFQGISVINYPQPDVPYTRICEPKHFYREKWCEYVTNKTLTICEFPSNTDTNDPYYPVNDSKNNKIYEKYKNLAASKHPNIIFGGRLAEYKYFNMSDVISQALKCSSLIHKQILANKA